MIEVTPDGKYKVLADRFEGKRLNSPNDVIVGPDGYPLAGPVTADEPAVLVAPCDLARARNKQVSAHNDVITDRRPLLYRQVAE